jgi:hypothetical protein
VSSTANHPDIHAASTPEAVPAELMLLWLNVFQPLRFREADIPVRKTAYPIRVAALSADVLFAGAPDIFNSAFQPVLYCRFPRHRLPLPVSDPQ